MARIVLNPFGSFGDLHPFLALALELGRRGHCAVLATSEVYRRKVEAEGVTFAAVRPDLGELAGDEEQLERLWDPRSGTEYLLRELIFPRIEESYENLLAATEGADLLITHTAGYAGPIVAERTGIRWLSVALQPMVFFSAYDPPLLEQARWLTWWQRFGRWPFRLARALGRFQTCQWARPVRELRQRLGLAGYGNPVFEGQFSSQGTLALFSRAYAQPQPDWPPRTTVTGFVFYDEPGAGWVANEEESAARLAEFLDEGPPPIVFTLGSSAVMQAGTFFRESMAAVKRLDVRAVMLTGPKGSGEELPAEILELPYARFSELLPRASATVHQGGIGTTAQALAAGRPMLVVPWSHDQPDNAERVRRIGAGRVLARERYTAATAERELRALLNEPSYTVEAQKIRERLLEEDGRTAAADAVERALETR